MKSWALARNYILTGAAGLAIGLVLGLFVPHCAENRVEPMASIDQGVPKHDVMPAAPVKALDKKTLVERGVIAKSVEKAPESEVTATAKISDSSGSRNVAAVLDVGTGETQILEHRKFMESMKWNELGVNVGWGTKDGLRKEVYYRRTFFRVWEGYVSGNLRYEQTDPGNELLILGGIHWGW